jgi:hypothetical protein
LSKWRWRLLSGDNSLWKEVIKGKYGGTVIGKVDIGEECKPWFSSTWWRDICSIGINRDQNWFANGVVKKMGNGVHTNFWEDVWIGNMSLREQFPRLFSISVQQEASVVSVWNQDSGWNLNWRRGLFVWELNLLNEMLVIINSAVLTGESDRWGWRLEKDEDFTVKSTYELVSNMLLPSGDIASEKKQAFKAIWNCPVPSKAAGCAWLVIQNRVPTRENLLRRRVIQDNREQGCVLCGDNVESVQHLFLYCNFTLKVWECITKWLGMEFVLPHNILSLLNFMTAYPGSKQLRKGMALIWVAVIWIVWRHRNSIIFSNGVRDIVRLVDDIKIISWKWWIGRTKTSPCLYYEWCVEPVLCMSRK